MLFILALEANCIGRADTEFYNHNHDNLTTKQGGSDDHLSEWLLSKVSDLLQEWVPYPLNEEGVTSYKSGYLTH